MPYVCKSLLTTKPEPIAVEKRLSICLRANGFSFSVTAVAESLLLAFGEAEGEHAANITTAIADIKGFIAAVGINPLDYRHTELMVLSQSSTWVPTELYDAAYNKNYLKLVGASGVGDVATTACGKLGTAVYDTNLQLLTAFKVALPGLAVKNQHVRFAEMAYLGADHPTLLVHWRGNVIDVAAYADGRYLYSNTMTLSGLDEASFRLVEVMKVFRLESAATELLLCGEVEREHYARLKPYFPKATLFTGHCTRFQNPEFRTLHTYRHALLLTR